MAKLSVIVCVYNTNEDLFGKCLKSLFDSSEKDLEIIVIDDGSTVDYTNLIKKYKTIKYFKTENHGTLKARLYGISKATSPYVCFADSDDTVSFMFYEAMLARAEKTNASIVFNDWAFHTSKSRYFCRNDSTIGKNFMVAGDGVLQSFFKQKGKEHSFYVLWNKIFKLEVLQQAKKDIFKLSYDNLVFAEDVLISYYAFKHAQTITNTHLGFYFYRIHDSQEIAVTSAKKLENHVRSMSFVFNMIESDLKISNRYDEMEYFFSEWKKLLSRTGFSNAKHGGHKDLIPFIKESYNVKKVQYSKIADGSAYSKQKVLPTNIEEIDETLKKLYFSKKVLRVCVSKNTYAYDTMKKMNKSLGKEFEITPSTLDATLVMPEEIYSLKQKFLHNNFVSFVGMILFPKGSKIRKKLKSKL